MLTAYGHIFLNASRMLFLMVPIYLFLFIYSFIYTLNNYEYNPLCCLMLVSPLYVLLHNDYDDDDYYY